MHRIRSVLFQVVSSWLAPSTVSTQTPLSARIRQTTWLLVAAAAPLVAQAAPASLAFAPYAFQTLEHGTFDAEVAFLEVPARHADPDGTRMRLRVVRLPATGGDGSAAPVVYLAGGPGGSGVGTARGARWPVFDQVRKHADVLLLDQRGTGESAPPAACPQTHRFDDAQPLQRDEALAALRGAAARCVAYWQEQGIDLGAYTSEESADDIAALRAALGVPKVSLWGMSYGTHLAMATLRRHGAGLERVVLMGAEGPDDTLKLPLSADAMLAELERAAAKDGFTDLTGAVARVLAALQQQPVQGRSMIHRGRQVSFGAFDAQLAIAAAVGRRSAQQLLPLALRDAEQGDYDLLASLVLMVRDDLQSLEAMPLAMDVASAQSTQRRALVQAQTRDSVLGNAINFPYPELGDGLGLIDLGEAYRGSLHSEVPTLFVSGTLDGRTPLANAAALLPGFSNGAQLLVRNASHDDELWLGHADISATISRFPAFPLSRFPAFPLSRWPAGEQCGVERATPGVCQEQARPAWAARCQCRHVADGGKRVGCRTVGLCCLAVALAQETARAPNAADDNKRLGRKGQKLHSDPGFQSWVIRRPYKPNSNINGSGLFSDYPIHEIRATSV